MNIDATRFYVTHLREPDFVSRSAVRILFIDGGEPKSFTSKSDAVEFCHNLGPSYTSRSVTSGGTVRARDALYNTIRFSKPASTFRELSPAEERQAIKSQPTGGRQFLHDPKISKSRINRSTARHLAYKAGTLVAYVDDSVLFDESIP